MTALALLPAVLSLLVLGAHFLRAGQYVPIAIIAFTLLMLPVRHGFVARWAQIVLALGSLEWLRTLLRLADARLEAGAPVTRLSIILLSVTLLALLAALLFQGRRLQVHYRRL
jgi:hypothetical protein